MTVKEPVPIRWACGECGAEMCLLPEDKVMCLARWCPQRNLILLVPNTNPNDA